MQDNYRSLLDSDETVTDLEAHNQSPIIRSDQPSLTYMSLLAIPRVQLLCILIVVASACQNFTFPTLAAHLKTLGVSESFASLEFFLYSFFYMTSTPLVGRLIDSNIFSYFAIIFFGNLCGSIGFLIIGPASFATFLQSNLHFTSVGLVVMGFSLGFALIPTFEGILQNVRQKGVSDDLQMYGKVSGLWTCMFSLG
jgi:hypothetical protein